MNGSEFPGLPGLRYGLSCDFYLGFPWGGRNPGGACTQRAWNTSTGVLVLLGEIDNSGVSITTANRSGVIEPVLREQHPDAGEIVIIEHWPEGASGTEHWDQFARIDGVPSWRRIWPVKPGHPDHDWFAGWIRSNGEAMRIPSHIRWLS